MGFYVYTLSDPHTKEVRYVGQTERPLATRLAEHQYNSKSKRHNTHLYCWWRSCSQPPEIELLEEYSSAEEMDKGEIHWINRLRTIGARLTNHSEGGDAGFRGMHHSKESRAKMGRPISQATRESYSRAAGVRSFVDETGTTWNTIAEAAKKLDIDPAAIGRILAGKQKKSHGHLINVRSVGGHFFKYTDSTSHSMGPLYRPTGAQKPITDDAGNVWRSSKEAAKALRVSPQSICDVLKGRRKSCLGHVLRYLSADNLPHQESL